MTTNKKILIIEDEKPAAKRLVKLVQSLATNIKILGQIDSVEDAVIWLQTFDSPDLIFMDIQLADGLSFSIFDKVKVTTPVIFTTAYDQYAIKAFKVNSIDYLLKPIDPKELNAAWNKFLQLENKSPIDLNALLQSFQNAQQQQTFKERFLIKIGEQYKYLTIDKVAYFYSEGGATYLMTHQQKNYLIDDKLDALESQLNPTSFFRINRKFIISINAIHKIHSYFNSRLKLDLTPKSKAEIIVARDRVMAFKAWLNN